jgi:hypothetical protein
MSQNGPLREGAGIFSQIFKVLIGDKITPAHRRLTLYLSKITNFLDFAPPRAGVGRITREAQLVWLVLLSGLIYSTLIYPMPTEQIEFAQTLAGQVPISNVNFFFIDRQGDPSLLVLGPALLLKIGVSVQPLLFLASALAQIVPFLAVALLIFLFTQNLFISYFSILFFLSNFHGNIHFYPLVFPTNFYVFGNLANWFCILCLGLFLNGFKKATAFLTGLMISIHLAWAIPAIFYFGYFLIKEKYKKTLVLLFLAGAVISAGSYFLSYYFTNHYFKESIYTTPVRVYSPPVGEQILQAAPITSTTRTVFQGHNPHLYTGDWNRDLKQLYDLILFSALSFTLGLYLVRLNFLDGEKVSPILKPYFVIFLTVIAFLILMEITDYFDVFPILNHYALRAIPNRYLNL